NWQVIVSNQILELFKCKEGAIRRECFFVHKIFFMLFFMQIWIMGINHVGFASQGFSSDSKFLNPGKIDFHYSHTRNTDEYNFIGWTPLFKGGWGHIDFDGGGQTDYVGGYISPLLKENNKGELILGFLQVDSDTSYSYEFQGEYRFPFGLGFGGGSVSRNNNAGDTYFGKLSYRNKYSSWNYIVSAQHQDVSIGKESPGGYIAVYDDILMLVYGNDGEQWRSTFGVIAPKNDSMFRPALEVFYVDNTIGNIDGNQFLFVNATLKFKGGFLSHPARLGRAMGPTGMEFGNPLGYLSPTWNRRLDVFELGDVADFRLVRSKTPSGVVTEKFEVLAYPFQFREKENLLNYFYAGGFYSTDSVAGDSSGILGGIFGKVSFLQVGIGGDYNLDTDEKRIFLGIIDKF
ncbi:hypothetical protein KAR91_13615, partial [Candidatus Pacearchaeota archaeon]|nr:hypothetical protein [Candidatus Pacearchaeota archaeon]